MSTPSCLRRAAGGLVLATALAGCGARTTPDDREQPILRERAQACRTMLREFVSTDLAIMTEARLETAMDRARANVEPCTRAFADEARTPGEVQIAAHEGRQFQLYALVFEGTLSQRFDGYAGYCPIVRDTFQLLLTNVTEIESTLLDEALDEEVRRQLGELRDLDLEAMDVLFIASEDHCQ